MQATPDAADQVTALLEAGEYEDAIRLLEGISQSDDRTLATFHLGRAYEAVGDRERALDAYRTFLTRTASADEQLGAVIHARKRWRDSAAEAGGVSEGKASLIHMPSTVGFHTGL